MFKVVCCRIVVCGKGLNDILFPIPCVGCTSFFLGSDLTVDGISWTVLLEGGTTLPREQNKNLVNP